MPTIQRIEASSRDVRGVVHSLTEVVLALNHAGVGLIGEGIASGRGVRLKFLLPKH